MSQDKAMRARVDGRQKKAALVVWQLTVGPLQFRCVRNRTDSFQMETRSDKGWGKMGLPVNNPLSLLRFLASHMAVEGALRDITRNLDLADRVDEAKGASR